jgi:DeoR/GlpR family transcriptional regulator of sugar metabolism
MLKKERQKNILNLLKTKKIIKTSEFVQILKVNRTTIYRDLQELIEQSKVVENSK